jgi:hypothetical protein
MQTMRGVLALAVVAGALGAAPAGATITFDVFNIDTDTRQSNPVLTDVDRDGQADLVGGDTMVLRRTDGSPGSPTVWLPGGLGAQTVLVGGPFSFDADSDILTGDNSTPGQCRVRRYDGDGSGGFTPTPGLDTTVGAECTDAWATTDLNNDGTLDAFGAFELGSSSWWWSELTGFVTIGGAAPVLGVAAGDVNGDGRQDLLALTTDGLVHQRLSMGVSYQPETTFAAASGATGIAAGDLTGDLEADVVTVNLTTIRTRQSEGGTLSQPFPGGGARGIALADIDGDGWLEQLISFFGSSNAIESGLAIRVNSGSGVFSTPPTFVPGFPFSPRVTAATDASGRLDAVATGAVGFATNTLYLNRSTGKGAFQPGDTAFPNTAVGQVSAPIAQTFRNTGHDILRIDRAYLAGLDADQYKLVADGCQGMVLKRNQTCQISTRFTPTSVGVKQGLIRVLHDGDGTRTQTDLTGTGAAAAPGSVSEADVSHEAGRDGTLRCSFAKDVCTLRLRPQPEVTRVTAVLRRKGRVVARGQAQAGSKVRLAARRPLRAGRYRVRVARYTESGIRSVTTWTVRLG